MTNTLSKLLFCVSVLFAAEAHAQSNVPPQMNGPTIGPAPERSTAAPPPAGTSDKDNDIWRATSIVQKVKKGTNYTVQGLAELAPDKDISRGQIKAFQKIAKPISNAMTGAKIVGKALQGDSDGAARATKEFVIGKCIDGIIAAACTVTCGPAAPGCIAVAQIGRLGAEAYMGQSLEQMSVKYIESTIESFARSEEVNFDNKRTANRQQFDQVMSENEEHALEQAAASAAAAAAPRQSSNGGSGFDLGAMMGGILGAAQSPAPLYTPIGPSPPAASAKPAGCHSGHDEQAHPGGCHRASGQ